MKTYWRTQPWQQLALVGGAGCLLGWLAGSHAALVDSALPRPVAAALAPRQAAPWLYPDSLDALVAAPRFHRVLFENDRVRVLEVAVPPQQREPVHTHRWPSVLYRPASPHGTGRYYGASGQVLQEFAAAPGPPAPARARWQEPEGPHAVENTGAVADHFIRVELKQ